MVILKNTDKNIFLTKSTRTPTVVGWSLFFPDDLYLQQTLGTCENVLQLMVIQHKTLLEAVKPVTVTRLFGAWGASAVHTSGLCGRVARTRGAWVLLVVLTLWHSSETGVFTPRCQFPSCYWHGSTLAAARKLVVALLALKNEMSVFGPGFCNKKNWTWRRVAILLER